MLEERYGAKEASRVLRASSGRSSSTAKFRLPRPSMQRFRVGAWTCSPWQSTSKTGGSGSAASPSPRCSGYSVESANASDYDRLLGGAGGGGA